MVCGLWFVVCGFVFGVWCLGLRVWGLGFVVLGVGLRILRLEFVKKQMFGANYVVPYVLHIWSGTLPSKIGGSKLLVVHRVVFDFTDKNNQNLQKSRCHLSFSPSRPSREKALLQTEDGNQIVG